MKKYLLLCATVLAVFTKLSSQTNNDCIIAIPLCSTPSFTFNATADDGNVADIPNGNTISNPQTNVEPGNQGCLLQGENNPQWLLLSVGSAGMLEFVFGAGNSANTQGGFYDWAMWPYTPATCNAIMNNTLPPVRCNWNASNTGGTGLASNTTLQSINANAPSTAQAQIGNFQTPLPVNAGDKFVICISNFSNLNTLVSFLSLGTASLAYSPNCAGSNPCSQTITLGLNGTVNTFTGSTLNLYSCAAIATLTAPPNISSYQWSGPAGIASTTSVLTTTIPGTYTLTLSQPGICSVSKTFFLSLLNAVTSQTALCAGSTATLTATGLTGYVWSTGATTPTISVSPNVTTGYSVSGGAGYNSTCTTGVVQPVVSCTANPCLQNVHIEVNGNTSILNGGTINLYSCESVVSIIAPPNFSSYLWQLPGGGTSSVASVTALVSGNYTLVLSKTGVCTATNSIALTVFNVVTSGPLLCAGNTATLTATGLNSYLWNTGETTPAIQISPNATTGFTVSGIAANGYSCARAITQQVGICTGIKNTALNEQQIILYPNPNNGEFMLNITKQLKQAELVIENTLGQVLFVQPVLTGENKIKTKNLAAGIYYYTVKLSNIPVATGKIKIE